MIDMKKLFTLFVVAALFFVSCGKHDPVEENSANKVLQGTKWTVKSWDHSLGDDWAGIHEYTTVFYFHSISEGVLHLMNEDFYTDMGSSATEKIEHFKYTVDGNTVYLEYVTDGFMNLMRLNFDGSNICVGTTRFVKSSVSDSDRQWLNSVCGKTGSCSWYSNANGKLWIVGDGPMADYDSFSETPWASKKRIPNKISVGEGVTKIGAYSFANSSIAEVEMPDKSLTEVGASAFKESLISTIWISPGTKKIGSDAFKDCKYLKHINVPDQVVSIGQCAFSGTALNEFQLAFPESLEVIQAYAFEGGKASYLIFNEGVRGIMTGAFLGDYCGIDRELILPNSLMTIGATVFEGVYNKVVIGTNICEIGDKAFVTGSATGDMFVNRTTPPNAGEDIIVERTNWRSAESGWTLHVPSGSKSVYSKTAPWNKFKAIVEDGSVEEPDNPDGSEGSEGPQIKVDYTNLTYNLNDDTYKMILVDGGVFPAFYMMQTELPLSAVLQIGNYYIGAIDTNGDNCIIKAELRNFIEKLNEATGLEFRLPTEDEWKFAAKGGVKSKGYKYSGSDNIDDVAWYVSNCDGLQEVATKQPNELGFYDMSGNYAEVCDDDPKGIDGRTYGGSWDYPASACTPESYKKGDTSASKIPGTSIKELNAVDGRYITVRLVYSVPE